MGASLRLRERKAELLIILIFFLLNLRVLSWFEYPNVLIGGDSRPPLSVEAFLKRVLNAWDETDFGMPSVYQPRILDPYYLLIVVIQALGGSLYLAQMISLFLMYSLTSILAYVYVKQIADGDRVVALVAAIFLTSNLHLITDREVSAIGVVETLLMILPSVVVFTEGVVRGSYTMIICSTLLFVITYGAFPNYRPALLCIIMLLLTLLFMHVKNGIDVRYKRNGSPHLSIIFDVALLRSYTKYLALFVAGSILTSLWILAVVLTRLSDFAFNLQNIAAPSWIFEYIKFHDVPRLIAKWGFYAGALGKPYVPYASAYFNNPILVILSYLPPILAFTTVLVQRNRRTVLYFVVLALSFLFLSAALPSPEAYASLMSALPFMMAFRESAQWFIFVALFYGILIGELSSTLYRKFRRKPLQAIALVTMVAILVSPSYPLFTGDVARNWMKTEVKGSSIPLSYFELNEFISEKHWTLLLPKRGTYVVYDFNTPFNAGNPYPLMFSKPIITGVGTEYMQPRSLGLLDEIHKLLLEGDYENVAPRGKASASSIQDANLNATCAIDKNYGTRWASGMGAPQWIEISWNETQELLRIRMVFESALADDYVVETWNGTCWERQVEVRNNTKFQVEHAFSRPIPTTKLRVTFTKASAFNMVSVWELEAYARTERTSKFLGMLGIKHLVVEKRMILGNAYDVSQLHINESRDFVLVREWNEIALYDNVHSLQKLYVAWNVLKYDALSELYDIVDRTEWRLLQSSVLVNSSEVKNREICSLVPPEDFTWRQISPTSYEVRVTSRGPFFLVLLQAYDGHWRVHVNGKPVPEANHYKVNLFANGWLIDEIGPLTITIQYEAQNLISLSVIVSTVALLSLMVFLERRGLRRMGKLLYQRLKAR